MGALTRRSALMMPAAVGLALAQPAIASLPASPSMMAVLAERNRLADWINAEPCWGEAREAERDAIYDRVFAMERQIHGGGISRDALEARMRLALKLDEEGAQLIHSEMLKLLRAALNVIGAES